MREQAGEEGLDGIGDENRRLTGQGWPPVLRYDVSQGYICLSRTKLTYQGLVDDCLKQSRRDVHQRDRIEHAPVTP